MARVLDAGATDETSERILGAALEQMEEFGLRRTTVEDVARRARIARVTLYRRFPSKEAVVQAVVLREVEKFFAALDDAVALYEKPSDRLIEGFAFALDYLRRHALFNRLLKTEPESVLPQLTSRAGPIISLSRAFLADRLSQDIEVGSNREDAEVAAEMLTRLVLSFLLTPESIAGLQNTDAVRDFARSYLVPLAKWRATVEPRDSGAVL